MEAKFYEWMLHHTLAVFLIFFATLYNYYIVTVLVLTLHDKADIFVTIFKSYSEMQYKKDTWLFFYGISMILTWGITRVYLYPNYVIIPAY